jgi:putative ABC transport system substrate-binding protein
MNRRDLLVAFSLGALTGALPALAQQKGKIRRIGFFYLGSRQSALETGRYQLFLQAMRDLGYVEGKHFVIEARYADGKAERLPDLAAELVRSKVDVIVATGTPLYQALQKATKTIPIVITTSPDPVRDGFAASLARPGGNFTGLSSNNAEAIPKHVELLMTAVPRLSRIAVLRNPDNVGSFPQLKSIQAAAQKTGLQVLPVDARTPDGIERGFSTMAKERAEAVIIPGDTFFLQQVRQIAELALKHRLPSTYVTREYAEAGGFMSYGQNITENFRRAATYVDKILKGAKPGELPIEQPTIFELVINRKTARAIGLTIPQELLLRADRVIE